MKVIPPLPGWVSILCSGYGSLLIFLARGYRADGRNGSGRRAAGTVVQLAIDSTVMTIIDLLQEKEAQKKKKKRKSIGKWTTVVCRLSIVYTLTNLYVEN